MKLIFNFILVSLFLTSFTFFPPAPPTKKKIQIAILLDTSSSMNGLIEQAKTTIWQIVNAAGNLENNGEQPILEISLYDYGNSSINNPKFVRLQASLIQDLDSISGQLFGLSTNGGDEFCAQVIESAMNELAWSNNPDDLRLIYIAGNEPFNQGSVDYKKVLADAASKNIIVNTIYCGDYQQGVREFWYDGSLISQGNYFNINSNADIPVINTPYDSTINTLNGSLNETYISYGAIGMDRQIKQRKEDDNAFSKGYANTAERTISKSSKNYSNASWDLIDAQTADSTTIYKLKPADLPDSLKNKSPEELKVVIDKMSKERAAIQTEINELAKKRNDYIVVERKKLADQGKTADLGSAIIQTLNSSAAKKGYSIKK